jgi:hypothetical protein
MVVREEFIVFVLCNTGTSGEAIDNKIKSYIRKARFGSPIRS